jgi:NAD(P)-dependent dehydrogenase (short-subunit alcohol dehydrogenase family)
MANKTPTALITGASGGIGKALVKAFSKAGYRVLATDRIGTTDLPEAVYYLSIDLERFVNDVTYADALISEAMQYIGEQGLNVLVNNAAIQILGGVEDITRHEWKRSFDVNLTAPFLLSQAFLAALEKASGSVINISSIHARLTKKNFVAYATTKSALSGLTRSMAVDLGNRIRVNAIEPAAIDTPMLASGFSERSEVVKDLAACHPQQRIGTSEEIAALALAIAENRFGFMHGACVALDGAISNLLFDPL